MLDETQLKGFQISVETGHSQAIPTWWGQLWTCAQRIASDTVTLGHKQRFYVLSVPQMQGALSSISLGLLDGVLNRVLSNTGMKEINIDDVKPGMLVRIESGQTGTEVYFGEVGDVDTSSSYIKLQVGRRRFTSRFITKIQLLSAELGKPEGHYSKVDPALSLNQRIFHRMDPLRHSKEPVLRPFLVLRTVPEHAHELEWVIYDPTSHLNTQVQDLLHSMQKGETQAVATLVANTKQSLLSRMQDLKVDSFGLIDSVEVTCLVGTKAILENMEDSESKITVCVLARDEDSIESVQTYLEQMYAYGEKIEWDSKSSPFPESVEMLAFERSGS